MIKKKINSIAQTIKKSIKDIRQWLNGTVITQKNSCVPGHAQNTQVPIIKTYRIIWNSFSPDKYCSTPYLEIKRFRFELLSNDTTTDTSEN